MTSVLLVDDSYVVGKEVESALAGRYELVHELDGVAGLERLRSGNFALALLDVNMPRMGGIEMAKIASAEGLDVPMVMLTSEAQPALVKEAKAASVLGSSSRPGLLAQAVDKITGTATT